MQVYTIMDIVITIILDLYLFSNKDRISSYEFPFFMNERTSNSNYLCVLNVI